MVCYGELLTKGKNRQAFIGRLNGNVTRARYESPNLSICGVRDRSYIELNGEPSDVVMARLCQVSGIQNFLPSMLVEKDMAKVHEVLC